MPKTIVAMIKPPPRASRILLSILDAVEDNPEQDANDLWPILRPVAEVMFRQVFPERFYEARGTLRSCLETTIRSADRRDWTWEY